MTQMVIIWTTYDGTHSSLAVGGIGLATGLPTIVFGLIGGALTDLRRPRVLGTIGIAGQAITTLAMFIAAETFGLGLGYLYGLVVINSAMGALTIPTQLPFIRHLVQSSSIPAAMSLLVASMNLGQIAGPLAGGVLLGSVGAGPIYAIHVGALTLYCWAVISLPDIPAASDEAFGPKSIAHGVRVTWRLRDIRLTLLLDLFVTCFALPTALIPAFNSEILGGDARTYGALIACLSAGGVIATLVSGWLEHIRRAVSWIAILALIWCGTCLALALTHSFQIALVITIIIGILDAWCLTLQKTVFQRDAPEHALGRVGSVQKIAAMAGPQIGNFRAGTLGSLFGPQSAIIIGAMAGMMLVGGTYLLSRMFEVRERTS